MPSETSILKHEYYGHPKNQFWKILFSLFEIPFSNDYEVKKFLLTQHQIALWDVLLHCEGTGSLDSQIKNEVANDFLSFYKKYPNIKSVYFTSLAAGKFYKKYVGYSPERTYFRLPSPSPAHAAQSFAEKIKAWQQLLA